MSIQCSCYTNIPCGLHTPDKQFPIEPTFTLAQVKEKVREVKTFGFEVIDGNGYISPIKNGVWVKRADVLAAIERGEVGDAEVELRLHKAILTERARLAGLVEGLEVFNIGGIVLPATKLVVLSEVLALLKGDSK